MTFGANAQVRLDVDAIASPIDTNPETTVTHNGVTFEFDRPMQVGVFAGGEPFVVTDQGFEITAISPAASDIEGDGYIGNGTMKNPLVFDADERQGFDAYLGDYPSKQTYETPYDGGLNIDPGVAGNIAFVTGEKTSIVKSVRMPAKTSNTAQFQTIEEYVVLTVLDASPPIGTCRPGMAGTTKTLRGLQNVAFTPRNIALPASWPSVATILNTVPDNLAPLAENPESRRFFRTDDVFGTTSDGYSGGLIDTYGRYVYAVNSSDLSQAERDAAIVRILTFANDIEAVQQAGASLGAGAGQGGGIWLWLMAAAALTRDGALMAATRAYNLQVDESALWVGADLVGVPAPGKNDTSGQTYFAEQVGTPWVEPEHTGSNHSARYIEIAAKIVGWEVLSILAFEQGPAGYANGAEMILNGGSNASSNALAAPLAFCARWETWVPNSSSSASYDVPQDWLDAWADMKATGEFTSWSGAPDQPPLGSDSQLGGYFLGGDGQLTLSVPSGFNYTTEPVVRRDMRYSLDGVQWVEEADIGTLPYTKSGLLRGVDHWCGWRQASASGTSPWSPNFPRKWPLATGTERDIVSTSGSQASVAPSYSGGLAPALQLRQHPGWEYKLWQPAPTTIGINDTELAAGVGYAAAGYPAPTYTFQWRRNGSDISGATTQFYTRTAADAGAILSCEVTATNGSGSASVVTQGVTCPAIQAPAGGALIDTDFRGAFAIDYANELAGITTNNARVIHLPSHGFSEVEDYNFGALQVDKQGNYPGMTMPLSRAFVAGTSYRVEAQIVSNRNVPLTGDVVFQIRRQSNSVSYGRGISTPVEAFGVINVDFTIDIAASEVDLAPEVFLEIRTGSGGGSTDDPFLMFLRIAPV